MPANYVLLERIELNASAASVTFANIPQSGYTDLKVVASLRRDSSSGSGGFQIRLNGDSGSNYSARSLYGNGASAGSFTSTGTSMYVGEVGNSTDTANTFPSAEFYVPNYLSGTAKSVSSDSVTENNATTAFAVLTAGLWTGTAAINSVQILPSGSGSFVQYSTFSLYGLAAVGTTPVIAPKASGGNIDNDGTYWYHTFLTTGAFVPSQSLSCDVLVVAGGGGSGRDQGGGGGAGGLLPFTSQALTAATSYTATVGAGGAGSVGSQGSDGSDSQFAALTLVKGGGGGGQFTYSNNGRTGGSGGGGGFSGGSATSGQGNAGGNYGSSGGGGGGGKGGAGGNADPNPGAGGAGTNTYSSWASATATGVSGYYAGGGGGGRENTGGPGGAAGSGGGGAGAGSGAATAGTTNTGGGGGGGLISSSVGLAGGSGIVIIRYTIA
jgi:hypothetical protein